MQNEGQKLIIASMPVADLCTNRPTDERMSHLSVETRKDYGRCLRLPFQLQIDKLLRWADWIVKRSWLSVSAERIFQKNIVSSKTLTAE